MIDCDANRDVFRGSDFLICANVVIGLKYRVRDFMATGALAQPNRKTAQRMIEIIFFIVTLPN